MINFDRSKGRPEPIAALNKIIEIDNGEPLVDLREYAPRVLLIRDTVLPYARKTVAEMVHEASLKLKPGQCFGLVDAWRPFARQQRIYDWLFNCAKEAYPERDYRSLRRTVCRWAAPIDQKAPPGHCTGAALDLWLVDEKGEAIDVSAPFGRFAAAPTYAYGLTDEALENRMELVNALLSVGFSNCRDEWWHYSYGDAGWAVRIGEPQCIYGLATLPEDVFAASERLHAKTIAERGNPFLLGH